MSDLLAFYIIISCYWVTIFIMLSTCGYVVEDRKMTKRCIQAVILAPIWPVVIVTLLVVYSYKIVRFAFEKNDFGERA